MKTILVIGAIVSFILAIFGVPLPSIALVALGLALWSGSTLVGPRE